MPQLATQLAPPPGQAGQPLDNELSNSDVVNVTAGAIIPPGVFCEIVVVSGQRLLFPLKDATTGGAFVPNIVGVSKLLTAASEQSYVPYAVPNSGAGSTFAGYPIGYQVPVMTRGRIWVLWDGNTATALPAAGLGQLQVIHSSTGANPQGVVTTKAVSATAGFEIDLLSLAAQFYDLKNLSGTYTDPWGQTRSIVPMSLNFPGHS